MPSFRRKTEPVNDDSPKADLDKPPADRDASSTVQDGPSELGSGDGPEPQSTPENDGIGDLTPPEADPGQAADEDADLLSIFETEEEEDIDISALTGSLMEVDIQSLLAEAIDISAQLRSSIGGE